MLVSKSRVTPSVSTLFNQLITGEKLFHTNAEFDLLIDQALAEDLSIGDPTTDAVISSQVNVKMAVICRTNGILAGLDSATRVFSRIDESLTYTRYSSDGSEMRPGSLILEVEGSAASILKAERTAINFMQRLSGISTATAHYVSAVQGLNVRILDTRKTTPGWRLLEKYAVRVGGGTNHRQNLGDGILIKDNHIEILRREGLSLTEIVKRAVDYAPHTLRIEVEVESIDDVKEVLDTGVDIILLDNMDLDNMREAVELARGKAVVEASGGITLENVRQVAATGVDFISVGSITHSVKSIDMSLEVV